MKMSWSLEFRLIMLRCNLKTSKILIVLTKSPTASVVEKNVCVIITHLVS